MKALEWSTKHFGSFVVGINSKLEGELRHLRLWLGTKMGVVFFVNPKPLLISSPNTPPHFYWCAHVTGKQSNLRGVLLSRPFPFCVCPSFLLWLGSSISLSLRLTCVLLMFHFQSLRSQRRTARGVIRSSICGWRVSRWTNRASTFITEAWLSVPVIIRKGAVLLTVTTV